MDTIEIKLRKKLVIPFIGIAVLIMVIGTYVAFFTDKYKSNPTARFMYAASTLLTCYILYPATKKLFKNQPIIVLTNEAIILYTKGTVVIPKNEIKQIEVTYVNEQGHFLNIKTEKETHQTHITWLDQTPDEIKELIKNYQH